jgi:hypothetical protein
VFTATTLDKVAEQHIPKIDLNLQMEPGCRLIIYEFWLIYSLTLAVVPTILLLSDDSTNMGDFRAVR